jgi:hypothetical protein
MTEIKLSNKLFEEAEEAKFFYDKILSSDKFQGFDHLVFAKIKFLFKDNLKGSGWNKLGRVIRVNDLYWSLIDTDFMIIFNKLLWGCMETQEKITLILHFLSKIKVYYKYVVGGKRSFKKPENKSEANFDITPTGRINYKIVSPDIEKFQNLSEKFTDSYNSLQKLATNENEE